MMFGVSAGLPTLSWQGRRGERARAAHLRERRGSPESGLFYKTFDDVDLYGSSCSKARAGACDHLKGLAVSEGLAEWLVSAATGGAVAQASAGTWIGSYVPRQSGIYW